MLLLNKFVFAISNRYSGIPVLAIAGLQKLVARSRVCTYHAPKTLIRYTKKRAPKINSNVLFTKNL